jgi:hypothetical protein
VIQNLVECFALKHRVPGLSFHDELNGARGLALVQLDERNHVKQCDWAETAVVALVPVTDHDAELWRRGYAVVVECDEEGVDVFVVDAKVFAAALDGEVFGADLAAYVKKG